MVSAFLQAFLVLISCSRDAERSASPSAVIAARTEIRRARLDDSASANALEQIRFTPAGTQAAREVIEAGADLDALWAATWLYASGGRDPAPLMPLMRHEDPSIRVVAAAAVVLLGGADGFDVLARSAEVGAPLRDSWPRLSVGAYAGGALARHTGVELGPSTRAAPEELASAATRWREWLARNRTTLRYDMERAAWVR